MKHLDSPIVSFVKKLNHEFWLPAIQRKFVWKESQICELFDSVMREYPIGSFLVWRTKSNIRKRKFVENWEPKITIENLFTSPDLKEKALVIDGQQRIQSFYIGLEGRMGRKSLYFNIVSGDRTKVGSVIQKTLFEFAFMVGPRDRNWVRVSDILGDSQSATKVAKKLTLDRSTPDETADFSELILENVIQLVKTFKTDGVISYQLLDGTEPGNYYEDNDIVEVFVRANSGGTKLVKAELLFALLSSKWDSATAELEELESDLAEKGFGFSRDYFLKACLILLEKKSQYDVKKFRDTGTLDELKLKWKDIRAAITDVVDFLPQFTPIANSKALPSQNALLPLIAYRYFQPSGWKSLVNRRSAAHYIIRTSIVGSYNGAKDDLLDALVDVFKSAEKIDLNDVFNAIQRKGRATTISQEQFFKIRYKNNRVPLIMKLLRPDLDFVASNQSNLPTIDHLICKKLLKAVGIQAKEQVDQLANLIALSSDENLNEKRAKSISEWLSGFPAIEDQIELRQKIFLPLDEALWEPSRFDEFINARKARLAAVPALSELFSAHDAAEEEEDFADEEEQV